jgi:hypothetical protein
VKINSKGDFLISPETIQQLHSLELPITPPIIVSWRTNEFKIFRDFDTQEQAEQWLAISKIDQNFIDGRIEEVPKKIIAAYSQEHQSLSDDEKINAWNHCPVVNRPIL